MTNAGSPLEKLAAFKMILVERRRQIVETAIDSRHSTTPQGGEPDPGAGSAWGAEFLAVQQQIDAVDRAMADEKSFAATATYAEQLRGSTRSSS